MPDVDDRIRTLETAIRPFATLIAFIPPELPDDAMVVFSVSGPADAFATSRGGAPIPLTVGDIRRAAAATGQEALEGRLDSTRP